MLRDVVRLEGTIPDFLVRNFAPSSVHALLIPGFKVISEDAHQDITIRVIAAREKLWLLTPCQFSSAQTMSLSA